MFTELSYNHVESPTHTSIFCRCSCPCTYPLEIGTSIHLELSKPNAIGADLGQAPIAGK